MKLLLPNNLFARQLETLINKKNSFEIEFLSSSSISNKIEEDENSVGLIPTCDLLKHHELFVSSKVGISFDGLLSSSYFYLNNNFGEDSKVFVYGDVTSNDLILSKILISERYDIDIELVLDTKERSEEINNYLICGDGNFSDNNFETGISFADQVAEYINLPYVNFIAASKNEELLKQLNENAEKLDPKLEDNLSEMINKENITDSAKDFINMNIGSIYLEQTQNEVDALNELIKLPFFHGMVEEIHDLKFVWLENLPKNKISGDLIN